MVVDCGGGFGLLSGQTSGRVQMEGKIQIGGEHFELEGRHGGRIS